MENPILILIQTLNSSFVCRKNVERGTAGNQHFIPFPTMFSTLSKKYRIIRSIHVSKSSSASAFNLNKSTPFKQHCNSLGSADAQGYSRLR